MDSLVGKKVVVLFEEKIQNELEGEVVAHDEKGVLLKRLYRKRSRLEFIPKERIISLFHDEKKPRKAAVKSADMQETVATAAKVIPPVQVREAVKQLKTTVVEDLSAQLSFDDEDENPVPSVEDDEWGDD